MNTLLQILRKKTQQQMTKEQLLFMVENNLKFKDGYEDNGSSYKRGELIIGEFSLITSKDYGNKETLYFNHINNGIQIEIAKEGDSQYMLNAILKRIERMKLKSIKDKLENGLKSIRDMKSKLSNRKANEKDILKKAKIERLKKDMSLDKVVEFLKTQSQQQREGRDQYQGNDRGSRDQRQQYSRAIHRLDEVLDFINGKVDDKGNSSYSNEFIKGEK